MCWANYAMLFWRLLFVCNWFKKFDTSANLIEMLNIFQHFAKTQNQIFYSDITSGSVRISKQGI